MTYVPTKTDNEILADILSVLEQISRDVKNIPAEVKRLSNTNNNAGARKR